MLSKEIQMIFKVTSHEVPPRSSSARARTQGARIAKSFIEEHSRSALVRRAHSRSALFRRAHSRSALVRRALAWGKNERLGYFCLFGGLLMLLGCFFWDVFFRFRAEGGYVIVRVFIF